VSYDIRITDGNGETLTAEEPHTITGGTYAMGGTTEAWLNVTYNYAPHFYRLFGDKGIRWLYGQKVANTVEPLLAAASQLGDDVHRDYWQPTEGNAKAALLNLVQLARLFPDGVWDGD
jgi:hypothetical protein